MSKTKTATVEQPPQLLDFEAYSRLAEDSRKREAERVESGRQTQLARDQAEFRTLLWRFARTGLAEAEASRFQSLADRVSIPPQHIAELVRDSQEFDRLTVLAQQREARAADFIEACDAAKRADEAAKQALLDRNKASSLLGISSRATNDRNRLVQPYPNWIFGEDVNDAN